MILFIIDCLRRTLTLCIYRTILCVIVRFLAPVWGALRIGSKDCTFLHIRNDTLCDTNLFDGIVLFSRNEWLVNHLNP